SDLDRDHLAEHSRQGVTLESVLESWREREDRDDRRERELEAGIENQVRVPRQQREGAKEQEVPPVGRPCGQPGERAEGPCDSCSENRGLRPDREHVGADRRDRAELSQPAGDPKRPGQEKCAPGDQRDVLPWHGKEVVKARSAEIGPKPLAETLLVAENDAQEYSSALAVKPSRDRACEPGAQAVAEAAQAVA